MVVAVLFNLQLEISGAAFSYTPMEPIPGTGTVNDLPGLLVAIYKFGLWAIGIAALLMISIGGFSYMTSAGNTSKAAVGKKMITDAIIGLILALIAALLFTVINPNITSVNLQITPVDVSNSSSTNASTNTTATP